jgi:hypothetical protein
MIPRTFPSTYETINGQHRVVVFFLSSVTNLQRWADYIPVKFPQYEGQEVNTYNNEGIQLVDPLTSTTGKQAWLDYIPVYLDNDADDATLVSNTGYIPIGFNVAPSLSLDFTDPSETLDSRITFTRGSTGTRFNSSGVLESVAINTPRFDYDPVTLAPKGLLVEEQRTNSILQSEDFTTTWSVTRASVIANTIVSPNGTLTGDKLVEDTTASNSHLIAQSSLSFTSGTAYSYSLYAKAAERTVVRLAFPSAAFGAAVAYNFDLVAGTATLVTAGTGNTASITAVGNGWYRCVVSAQATSTTNGTNQIFLISGGFATYTGDGYSGIYIWGAQLEAGAFPTSYIPTVAASVTRNADAASMTGTNFSSWYRADEGTLFADINFYALQNFKQGVNFNDGSTNNFMSIQTATSPASRVNVTTGGVAQVAIATGNLTAGVNARVCFAYKTNDVAATLNGGSVGTDTSVTLPTVNQLGIGTTGSITSNGNQTIKKIAFYPSRLSNAQLQALTR